MLDENDEATWRLKKAGVKSRREGPINRGARLLNPSARDCSESPRPIHS